MSQDIVFGDNRCVGQAPGSGARARARLASRYRNATSCCLQWSTGVAAAWGEPVQEREPVLKIFSRSLLREKAGADHACQIQPQEAQERHDKTLKAKRRHFLALVRVLDCRRFCDLAPDIVRSIPISCPPSRRRNSSPNSPRSPVINGGGGKMTCMVDAAATGGGGVDALAIQVCNLYGACAHWTRRLANASSAPMPGV